MSFWRALEEVGEAREDLVEVTGELAGANHRDEQLVEQLRVLRERVGERRPSLTAVRTSESGALKRTFGDLLDERAERLGERDAGA